MGINYAADCASKFAIRGLTQTAGTLSWAITRTLPLITIVALELGQYGITVNACAPGLIRTQMSRAHSSYAL